MLDHTDHQIGRMVAFLEEIGRLDDTMVIVMSGNGASQEGQSTGVFDEMRHFNQLHEDVDVARVSKMTNGNFIIWMKTFPNVMIWQSRNLRS